MHRQQHRRVIAEVLVESDHRQLEDVRRCALNRRIGGHPFGISADGERSIVNFRNIANAPEQRGHLARAARFLECAIEVFLNFRITREICLDEILRLRSGDVQLVRQTKRRHSVKHTEIDCLHRATLVNGHLAFGHLENLRCSRPMNVRTLAKCLDQ